MARAFDGVSGKITISGSAINSLTTFTVALWSYRIDVGEGGFGRYYQKSDIFFVRTTSSSAFRANRWATAFGQWEYAHPGTSQWYHTAITYDYGSTANDPVIYVNGTSVSITEAQAPSGSVNADTAALVIGNTSAEDRTWNGRHAEFCIYNRILSADEIKTLYKFGPRKVPGGLVLYIPLIGASPEPDFSGNALNGTVTGTSVADHAPVAPPFGFDMGWMGAFAAATAGSGPQPNVFDSVSISESIKMNLLLMPNRFDLVTVTEAQTVNLNLRLKVNVFDSVTLAESRTLNVIIMPKVNDSITVSETVRVHPILMPKVSDLVTISESTSVTVLSAGVISINVNETVSISESIKMNVILMPNVFDSVTLTESHTVVLVQLLAISVSDTVSVSESVSMKMSMSISVFDAVTISESVTVSTGLKRMRLFTVLKIGF